MKPLNWTKELLVCLLLSTTFGVFVCSASDKILNRQDHRPESVEMERAILRGQPFYNSGRQTYIPPWQNRILFPALLELGIHLGFFSPGGWYVLLRLLSSIAMFAIFWLALRMNAEAELKLAGAGLLLLAYCLVTTFSSPYGMTSDFPDAMFTALFIVIALRHKRLLLLVLSILAAANRESSAFAGIIWFFLFAIDRSRKINPREAGFAALVSICSYASVVFLRFEFGGMQALRSNTQFLPFRNNYYLLTELLQHPTPFSWLGLIFCMIVPCVLWLAANRRFHGPTHKRLLAAAGTMAAISVVFGNVAESRIYIPSIVLTIFVAVWTEANRKPEKNLTDEFRLLKETG